MLYEVGLLCCGAKAGMSANNSVVSGANDMLLHHADSQREVTGCHLLYTRHRLRCFGPPPYTLVSSWSNWLCLYYYPPAGSSECVGHLPLGLCPVPVMVSQQVAADVAATRRPVMVVCGSVGPADAWAGGDVVVVPQFGQLSTTCTDCWH